MERNNLGNEYKTKKSKNVPTQGFHSKTKLNANYNQTSSSFFMKKMPDKNIKEVPRSSTAKTSDTVKKPFDKKKWRMQRYSKKYKLQQWEEHRKKSVLREYYRQIKDDVPPKVDVQKIYEEDEENLSDTAKLDELENENNLNQEVIGDNSLSVVNTSGGKKKGPHFKAHKEYDRLKEEKNKRREEFLKRKEERDKAFKEYKKKKIQTNRKLNTKTKKGQPVMKYKMEMLLEQIQNSTAQ